ncbi:MAG: toll/interleukin-1 receptor domain-containing protein, partial [Magnetococcales bacterium]|nr:toll/interleukin-1 receptor domain-containing protein [Magnetococcales bacterium]
MSQSEVVIVPRRETAKEFFMARIFLSHSSKNNPEAIAVRDWLVAHGWDDLFLDLDPDRGLVALERWEGALYRAADRCDAVLFLISQAWLASDWCQREFRLAHRLGKRLVGLIIDTTSLDALPAEFKAVWQMVNLAGGRNHEMFPVQLPDGTEATVTFSRSELTRLKNGLIKAGIDPRFFAWPPEDDPNRPPYRGLSPLEAADAGIFFGRDAPLIDLLARLRHLREAAAPRFLVILGASGAGKSSFLRAGLLPRLQRDDRNFLPLPVIRPEKAILTGDKGLLRCLEGAMSQQQISISRKQLRDAVAAGSSALLPLLRQLVDAATPLVDAATPLVDAATPLVDAATPPPATRDDPATKPPTLVLAIDQGEELFLAEGQAEAETFFALLKELLLAEVADPKAVNLIVLVTIRSDSYDPLQTHSTLGGIKQETYSLSPMPHGAYQAIIEGPAKLLAATTGREFTVDPQFTDRLLHDIDRDGGKDALPLLAFTLEHLYLEYGKGVGQLRLKDYAEMGGLKGAIEAAVERVFRGAAEDSELKGYDREACAQLLRCGLIPWLADVDPDTLTPRRRVAKWAEIPPDARPMIRHMIEQRLLTSDRDPKSDEVTIEPAHEALLRQWGELEAWLQADQAILVMRQGVQRAAREWAANNREAAWLNHSAARLEDAERLRQRDDLARSLGPIDREYLQACREQENQRRERELVEARKLAEAYATAVSARGHAEDLINYMLFDLRDKLQPLGRLDLLGMVARKAGDYFRQFADTRDMSPDRQRNQAVGLSNFGDVLVAQGDLVAALAAYHEYMAIAQRLAALDPQNAGWQRDLVVSHNKIGDVLVAQGDLVAALAAYREAMATAKRLAALDPQNAGWQRDLAVSHNKIGDVLIAQGNLVAALAAYREAMATAKRLAALDPQNAGWQRDLAVS